MAKSESAELKRYVEQMKAETDRAEELLTQRSKTVAILQKKADEKYLAVLEQEEAVSERERKADEREKELALQEALFNEKKEKYGPAIERWDIEKQQLLQETRLEAEKNQNEIRAASNEIAVLKHEIQVLTEKNSQLHERINSLLKRLL